MEITRELESDDRKLPVAPAKGIRCPGCGCRDLRVVYTRKNMVNRIKRVRECRYCHRRIVTFERSI